MIHVCEDPKIPIGPQAWCTNSILGDGCELSAGPRKWDVIATGVIFLIIAGLPEKKIVRHNFIQKKEHDQISEAASSPTSAFNRAVVRGGSFKKLAEPEFLRNENSQKITYRP
jgi:hypothetical protein